MNQRDRSGRYSDTDVTDFGLLSTPSERGHERSFSGLQEMRSGVDGLHGNFHGFFERRFVDGVSGEGGESGGSRGGNGDWRDLRRRRLDDVDGLQQLARLYGDVRVGLGGAAGLCGLNVCRLRLYWFGLNEFGLNGLSLCGIGLCKYGLCGFRDGLCTRSRRGYFRLDGDGWLVRLSSPS